jgi:hypothetical protein
MFSAIPPVADILAGGVGFVEQGRVHHSKSNITRTKAEPEAPTSDLPMLLPCGSIIRDAAFALAPEH